MKFKSFLLLVWFAVAPSAFAEEVVLGCVDCFSTMSLVDPIFRELFPDKTPKWILFQSQEYDAAKERYLSAFPNNDVIARIKLQPMPGGLTDAEAAEFAKSKGAQFVLGGMDVGSSRSPGLNQLLGFRDNSPETAPLRLHKEESLKVSGEFAIPTHLLKSVDAAVAWIKTVGVDEIIIKPDIGVFGKDTEFLQTTDEAHVRSILDRFVQTGQPFLLQPKIVGRKFYTNTYTENGVTKIVAASEYFQLEVEGKPQYYLGGMLSLHSPEVRLMQKAVNFLAPAHGIVVGPAHPEFIICNKTGRLYQLEMNGRVAGAGSSLLDVQAYGTSQLHLHLLKLFDYPRFKREFAKFPRARLKSAFMFIVSSPGDGVWDQSGLAALKAHPSYFNPGPQYVLAPGSPVKRTVSMDTSQGLLYFVGDRTQVKDGIALAANLFQGTGPVSLFDHSMHCGDLLTGELRMLLTLKMQSARSSINWSRF